MSNQTPTSRKNEAPVSDEFDAAITFGGMLQQTCGFCGRTCFASTGMEYDEGEQEQLYANAETHPDKYFAIDGDSIGVGELDGKIYISGCPCNLARRYEDFLIDNRDVIMRFYRAETERRLQDAKRHTEEIQRGMETP